VVATICNEGYLNDKQKRKVVEVAVLPIIQISFIISYTSYLITSRLNYGTKHHTCQYLTLGSDAGYLQSM
jgi:hypothetical protein